MKMRDLLKIKEKFTQNKRNPILMIQRPLDNKIRQPKGWNGRQWWWYGPPQNRKWKLYSIIVTS